MAVTCYHEIYTGLHGALEDSVIGRIFEDVQLGRRLEDFSRAADDFQGLVDAISTLTRLQKAR